MIGIEQILSSIVGAVGLDDHDDVLGLPQTAHYVLFVVDGMGELLLRDHHVDAPWMNAQHTVADVMAGVPSTTSASLTSLGTGLRPGQHGMVGYTVRVPGTQTAMNTLKWDANVDPAEWQPHPSLLSRLAQSGLAASTVVNDARFANSGLTRCAQRGVPFVGIGSRWQRTDAICDAVEAAPRSVVYAYESELDHTGHGKGSGSREWRDVLAGIDEELADLREALPADTTLIVTADHGMIDVADGADRVDVDATPGLSDNVVLIAGEGRLRHLFTRSGYEDAVASRWRNELGDRVEVRLRDDTEDWFGPIAAEVRPRIGDVVVACRDDTVLMVPSKFPVELTLRGFHGGLTDAERRIPVLVVA